MSERICFNQNAFLIGMILITVVILSFNQYFSTKKCPSCDPIIINKCNNQIQPPVQVKEHPAVILNKTIRRRDNDAINDDLSAPTRRLPKHLYPTEPNDFISEVPTRGQPDNYHHFGNMIRQSDEKIVKLFGRQIYPGSTQYEFYGITTDGNGAEIKIPIKTVHDKEIYDGDEIDIEFLDLSKGKFKLYMNEYDRPRYNPFVHQ
jgi:hypothetical protein